MNPITFAEQNFVFRGGQSFNDLPCFENGTETISRWQLTWRERFRIFFTGKLWVRQVNWGAPLQAQLPQVESPFVKELR